MAFQTVQIPPVSLQRYDDGDTVEIAPKTDANWNQLEALVSALSQFGGDLNTLAVQLQAVLDAGVLDTASAEARLDLSESTLVAKITEINAAIAKIVAIESQVNDIYSLSGVNLSELQTTADSISQLIASTGGLTVESISGLEEKFLDIPNQYLNEIKGHGRFLDFGGANTDDLNWWGTPDNAANFVPNALDSISLTGYNGLDLSAPIEASRHHYDSQTYGGAGAADDLIAQAFVNKISMLTGVSVSRYSAGFAIAEFTAGTGTASTSDGSHYRAISTRDAMKKHGQRGKCSFSCLIQPVGTSLKTFKTTIGTTNRALYINGVKQIGSSGEIVELAADTVYHICHTVDFSQNGTGYSSTAWDWLLEHSAKFRMALPVFVPDNAYIGPSHIHRRSRNPLGD